MPLFVHRSRLSQSIDIVSINSRGSYFPTVSQFFLVQPILQLIMGNTTQSSQVESSSISSSSVNGEPAVETSTISSPSVNSATVVATTASSSSSTYVASVETTSPFSSLFSTQPAGDSATRTPSRVANPSYTPTSKVAVSVPSQSNGKFSSGTLAGSIVGAFVGGYIMALLAAFLFFRIRKKSRKPREKARGSVYIDENSEKVSRQTVTTFAGFSKPKDSDIPLPQVSSAFKSQHLDLSTYMPQPADDHSVCMRIQSLFDQAGLHVENYYSRTASNPPLTRDLLARLSRYDSTSLPVSLSTILSNQRSRRAILTHVLVESLLHAIQPGETENSLLPANFAASPQQGGSEVADAGKAFWVSIYTKSTLLT
jgi:hypothetical protein